jgi:DNA gyrase subunit A
VKIIEKGDEIILFTRKGKSILFKEKDLREMSRMAIGVRAMKLAKDDEISAIEIISNNNKDSQILLITENGFSKRVKIKDFRLQKRGGSGIKAINIKEKTGYLVFAKVLDKEEKEVFVISKDGQVIKIDLNTIPVASRQAVGVRLMKLKENDKVVAATCI